MQCYEGEMMRSYVFGALRRIDPTARRDESLMEEAIAALGVDGMAPLLALDAWTVESIARRIRSAAPRAA